MARPGRSKAPSLAKLAAEIAEEAALHVSLQTDLREALILGEDTRPYRAAIIESGNKLASLRTAYAQLREEEEERRQAEAAEAAVEVLEGARRRHSELLAAVQPPPFPLKSQGIAA